MRGADGDELLRGRCSETVAGVALLLNLITLTLHLDRWDGVRLQRFEVLEYLLKFKLSPPVGACRLLAGGCGATA